MIELTLYDGILLKKAVAPFLSIALAATIKYSSEGLTLIALDNTRMVVAALRIQSSGFSFGHCESGYAGVDLVHLFLHLCILDEDDSVTIVGDETDQTLGILIQQNGTDESTYNEMALTEANMEILDFYEAFEYEVAVGVPSQEFRRIIINLSNYGESVVVTASDTHVQFSAINGKILLSKEQGQCVIAGVAANQTVHLFIVLKYKSSYLNAAVLSSTVWLFQSSDSPSILHCPVRGLGSITFYFG